MKQPEKSTLFERLSSSILKRSQAKQQVEIQKKLEAVEGIRLKASILRETNGQGGDRLMELLEKDPENPEIVMLIAGATDGMTYMQQALPRVFGLVAGESPGQNELLKNALEEVLREEGKAGIAEQMLREARQEVADALTRPMGRVSTVTHVINRAQEIREELFKDQECEMLLVQNANRMDVKDVASIGGNKRVVLIHGHGFRTSVLMTDDQVSNHELQKPDVKLKALILDTCGGQSPQTEQTEDMGTGIAETVYGFNRIATPRDIFGTPLRKKLL